MLPIKQQKLSCFGRSFFRPKTIAPVDNPIKIRPPTVTIKLPIILAENIAYVIKPVLENPLAKLIRPKTKLSISPSIGPKTIAPTATGMERREAAINPNCR